MKTGLLSGGKEVDMIKRKKLIPFIYRRHGDLIKMGMQIFFINLKRRLLRQKNKLLIGAFICQTRAGI